MTLIHFNQLFHTDLTRRITAKPLPIYPKMVQEPRTPLPIPFFLASLQTSMAVEASCTASPRDLKGRQITSGTSWSWNPGDRRSSVVMTAFITVAHIRN